MAGLTKNINYNYMFVEAQRNVVTVDPKGKRYIIYQGMQFKFDAYESVEVGCGCDGTAKKIVIYYYINALATCAEGEYLWASPKGTSLQITVTSENFIETESLKTPPIINDIGDEISGKDVDVHTPPWKRSIPREGGLWYTDPWHTNR